MTPRETLQSIIEFKKDPDITKEHRRILREGGSEKELRTNLLIKSPIAGAVAGGGIYGLLKAAEHASKTDKKLASTFAHAEASAGKKWKAKGAAQIGGLVLAGGALKGALHYRDESKMKEGLQKYPKSIGEWGEPGYTESYPSHSALPALKAYFKRPTNLSAREELDLIQFGKMEDEDSLLRKTGRVARSTAIGGLAGRLMAYHPVHGGKMNRGTLIGAGIGAASQGIAEHIAAAKTGLHGNPVRVKDESRKSVRDLGGLIPTLGVVAGGTAASHKVKKDSMDDMLAGMSMRFKGEVSEAEAIRQNTKSKRAMGMEGETFIPKMPKFGQKAAAAAGFTKNRVDETGGNVEDKLQRFYDRTKGTPEGAAAKRKLDALRERAGNTMWGKTKKAVSGIASKVGSMFRGKRMTPVSKVAGLLMSSQEELDSIIQLAAWTRKEGKSRSGGLNEKGRKSYERENPGSDLKAPSKEAGNPRRASFCARMSGMKKKLTSSKTANDPDSRINKSLKAWNCSAREELNTILFAKKGGDYKRHWSQKKTKNKGKPLSKKQQAEEAEEDEQHEMSAIGQAVRLGVSGVHGIGVFASNGISAGSRVLTVADKSAGVSITALGSKVNHSDSPNCKLVSGAREDSLIALREIRAGEEILASYSDSPRYYARLEAKTPDKIEFFTLAEALIAAPIAGAGIGAGSQLLKKKEDRRYGRGALRGAVIGGALAGGALGGAHLGGLRDAEGIGALAGSAAGATGAAYLTRNRKKELSAREELEVIQLGAIPQVEKLLTSIGRRAGSANIAARGPAEDFLGKIGTSYAKVQHPAAFGGGVTMDSFKSDLSRIAKKPGEIGATGDQMYHRKMIAGNIKKWRSGSFETPGGDTSFSARDQLNTILMGVDVRPRDPMGRFDQAEDGAPNPQHMKVTYGTLAAGAAGGAAFQGGGMGLKALVEKLKAVKKK